MTLDLVLNELSLATHAGDIYQARQIMSTLLGVFLAVQRLGVTPTFRTQSDLHVVELTGGYPVSRWRNDVGVSREERTYFKTLSTKYPLLVDSPELREVWGLYEFTYGGQTALGIGVAYLLDGIAVSLSTDSEWERATLEAICNTIEESLDNLVSETVHIPHASNARHVGTHAHWIEARRLRPRVETGHDIWLHRAQLFPRLQFCASIEVQLKCIDGGSPLLPVVVARLSKLNEYSRLWTDGNFEPERLGFKAIRESQATMETYGAERIFTCPDGINRPFTWHCWLSRSQRMHFDPDSATRQIIIGYVGGHLRTVRFRN